MDVDSEAGPSSSTTDVTPRSTSSTSVATSSTLASSASSAAASATSEVTTVVHHPREIKLTSVLQLQSTIESNMHSGIDIVCDTARYYVSIDR